MMRWCESRTSIQVDATEFLARLSDSETSTIRSSPQHYSQCYTTPRWSTRSATIILVIPAACRIPYLPTLLRDFDCFATTRTIYDLHEPHRATQTCAGKFGIRKAADARAYAFAVRGNKS